MINGAKPTLSNLVTGVTFCIVLTLITSSFAFASPSEGSSIEKLANKLIASRHSHDDSPALKAFSPYCMTLISPEVGSPAIRLSLLLMFPYKSSRKSCSKDRLKHPVKGTVFLFPGYQMDNSSLIPLGTAFARLGFASVLVDLPGQGGSGGAYIGYGYMEARYVNDLIRFLHDHNITQGRVTLMGESYGAAVAIDAAGLNPEISRVIAIAPFARVIPIIKRYAKAVYPKTIDKFTPSQFKLAISRAEQILGYKFNDHNPLTLAKKIDAPVLYIAGSKDDIAPLSEVRLLAENTPHATLFVAKGYGHVKLALDATHFIGIIKSWMSSKGGKPVYSGIRSYETGVFCHLVPTHKCWIMAGVSGNPANGDFGIGSLTITLKSENIFVPNGIYDGMIEIENGKNTVAKRSIKLSVNNGHVQLSQTEDVKRWLDKNIGSSNSTVQWESEAILKPIALPLRISDLSIKHGKIKAVLMYDGETVASSVLRMKPAKGCWIHERRCQPH